MVCRVTFVCALAVATGGARAEFVVLRDGIVLSGEVEQADDDGLVFASKWLGRLELPAADVERVARNESGRRRWRVGPTGPLGEDALRARGDAPDELLLVGGDRLVGRAEELPGGDVVFRTRLGSCRVTAADVRCLLVRADSWGPREIEDDELAVLLEDHRSPDASTRMTAFNIVALSQDTSAVAAVAELLAAPPGELEFVAERADTGVSLAGEAGARLVARNTGEHGFWVAIDDGGVLAARSTPRAHQLASLDGQEVSEVWRRRFDPPARHRDDDEVAFDRWAERAASPMARRVRRNPSTMDNGLANLRWLPPGGTVPAGQVGVSAKSTQRDLEELGIHRLDYDLLVAGEPRVDVTMRFPARHLVPDLPVQPWRGESTWSWNLLSAPGEVLDRMSKDYVDEVVVCALDTLETTELEVEVTTERLPGSLAEPLESPSADPRYPDDWDTSRDVWLCTHPTRNGTIPQPPRRTRARSGGADEGRQWRRGSYWLLVREADTGVLVDWRAFDALPDDQLIHDRRGGLLLLRKPPRKLDEPASGEVEVGAVVLGRDILAASRGQDRVEMRARISLPRLAPGHYEILVVTDLGVLEMPPEERATGWTPFVIEAR